MTPRPASSTHRRRAFGDPMEGHRVILGPQELHVYCGFMVEGGAGLAAAAWLLGQLLDEVPRKMATKLKQFLTGNPQQKALLRALDEAITRAVRRSGGNQLTDQEVADIRRVFNQLWPKEALTAVRGDTLTERMHSIVRTALDRSMEPVDLGPKYAQVTSLSALQQQYEFNIDPDQFADQLSESWVQIIRDAVLDDPTLSQWANRLDHDRIDHKQNRIHRAVEDLRESYDQRASDVQQSSGLAIPLEAAKIDLKSMYSDADVKAFAGRHWLVDQLDKFLSTHRSGYVWLEADAGLGKTALAGWLIRTRDYIGHLSKQSSSGATAALQNIAAQLITKRQLEDRAPGGMLPDWALTRFDSLLTAAAADGRPLVIVIDGLDEIVDPDPEKLPLGLPPALPDGVFVVGTYRTGYRPGAPVCDQLPLRIAHDDPNNLDDLRKYLSTAATEELLATKIAQSGLAADDFCHLAAQRCRGVWIYLHYLLGEIRLGMRRADDWDDLPNNLWDYYLRQFHRWHERADWVTLQRVLATLAALTEPVPPATLGRLAHAKEQTVRRYCDRLIRPFLHATGEPQRRYVILHTSFRQFLSGTLAPARTIRATDQAVAVAEHLREAVNRAHGRIADRYLAQFGGLEEDLSSLAADPRLATVDGGYPLRHLGRHLHHARRGEDLHRLLTRSKTAGPNRAVNVWFDAHDYAGTHEAFLADLTMARQMAEAATDDQIRTKAKPTGLAREILYTLMAASVHTMTKNVSPNLLVALVASGLWDHTRALSHARRLTNDYDRVQTLTRLAPHLPANQLQQALQAAFTTTGGYIRALALTGLAPHLPAEQLGQALQAATTITDEHFRVQALTGLAPHLLAEQLGQALQAATTITGEDARARALTGLAPHLSAEQQRAALGQALRAATTITNVHARSLALIGLAPHLSAEQQRAALGQALQAATTITNVHARAQALTGLAPHLSAEQQHAALEQALQAATTITDEYSRAQALTGLAPHLSAEQQHAALEQALQAATTITITDEYARAQALAGLAPYLSADQLEQALQAAITTITDGHYRAQALQAAITTITDGHYRAQALAELAPYLSADQLEQALQAATTTTDEYFRAQALTGLAPHLPAEHIEQALQATATITNERLRAQALTGLAPYLPAEHIQKALQAAATITEAHLRAQALTGLAAHLSAEQQRAALEQALQAATTITNEYSRALALTGLAPHLPAEQQRAALEQALQAAATITEAQLRARALTGLAAHLSVEQRRIALEQALRAATTITDEYFRSLALIGLAPHLSGEQQRAVLGQALQAATTITQAEPRARALTELAAHLPAEQQRAALEQALQAATTITDGHAQAQALTELAAHISAEHLLRLLQGDRGQGSSLEVAALTILAQLSGRLVSPTGVAVLRLALQQDDRASCLSVLSAAADLLSEDAGPATVIDILEAIRVVVNWWP